MLIAADHICGESELISFFEQYFAFTELTGADLWTGEVLQDGYGDLEFGGCFADGADVASVLVVGSVREIEASYVHP